MVMKSLALCIPVLLVIGCTKSTTAAADNTKNNARDRSGQTMTPTDQPENAADRDLAKTVRSALTDDPSLSTNAKNIKVIAHDGRVTLRGVVDNANERDSVVAKVETVAGVRGCDDQLDVKNH
jgi:osmotically-inducible protein OsmY